MSKYTIRITNDEEGIVAWIDQDGETCIKQPHHPSKTENWQSEEDALAWANKHAADLEAAHEAALLEVARKKELEAAQLAAAQAQVDTAEALKTQNAALLALVEKLTNPSA